MNTLKNLLWITSVFLFFSCNKNRQAPAEPDSLTEAEVSDFMTAYDAAWKNYDAEAIKESMGEKYIYFTSKGSTSDRDEIVSWLSPAGKYRLDTVYRGDVNIIINGNTAIVNSHWVGNGSFDGNAFNDDQRCGLVIQKRNGKLKIISEHCVQIAKQEE